MKNPRPKTRRKLRFETIVTIVPYRAFARARVRAYPLYGYIVSIVSNGGKPPFFEGARVAVFEHGRMARRGRAKRRGRGVRKRPMYQPHNG